MVMSIIGGAVFPPIEGLIFGATHSMAAALSILLVAYAYVAYYGFSGSRIRTVKSGN
jgi:fucose permease